MSNYINVDVEVDIDDVLWSMSSSEKQELVDDLYEDGYVPKQVSKYKEPETEFDQACMKLLGQSWRLTREEEQFIINLSKRF
jgi:hypothetical protein